MIVTTTSFIPNSEISEIVDVIHSRVVVGTNVFSDISASFSDFFGGNNSSYEKRLAEITEKSIDGLKRKAAKIKANAIIDLKIDVDEISGKNKSMFMVTAIGTAVVSVTNNDQINKSLSKEDYYIKGKDIDIEIKKNKIQKQLTEIPLKELDEKEWEFIIENQITEICYELLSCCLEWRKSNGTVNYGLYDEKINNYLYSLPEEDAVNILYTLYFDDKYSVIDDLILKVIKTKKIIDKKRIKELIEKIDRSDKLKYKIMYAVKIREELINIEDLEDYKALYKAIKNKFIEIVTYGTQKKIFSSTEEEVWICNCSSKNKVEQEYCHSCSQDIFGFYAGGVNPPIALEWLNNTITYIENIKNNKTILKN